MEKSLDIDEARLELFIKYLRNITKTIDVLNISFFGGEPLIKIHEIEHILEELLRLSTIRDCKVYTHITTNAYLLNSELIKSLFVKYGMKSIQITFDGDKKHHDTRRVLSDRSPTFDTILTNTKKLIEVVRKYALNDREIVIRLNYDDEDIEDIKRFLELFSNEEKKHFYIYFRKIYNTKKWKSGNSKIKNLHVLYSLANSKGFKILKQGRSNFTYCECDGGRNQLTILPDLSVWKCANDISYQSAKIGFIEKDAPLVIDEYQLMQWNSKNPFDDVTCSQCCYLPICLGGCPLNWLKNKKRNCFYNKGSIYDVLK
ncbi:MAG: SPASM domain-containing protein [Spirochaetia bacterium]|nr:SPASM domain-containing protein [Spirochaetia bacterium]